MMPDLDGLPILFDAKLYYAIHHELLHPLIYALLLGVLLAFLLKRLAQMDFGKTFAVFAAGYALHPLAGVVFTNWPVRLFWPLSQEQYSWPILADQNGPLATIVILGSFAIILKSFQNDIFKTLPQNH